MNDLQLVELYWERSERAISETALKYEKFCHNIAYNILFSEEDSEECVNDTWLRAWCAIPPQRPLKLSAFLGRITRNLSFNRLKTRNALRRGGSETVLTLDELSESIPASERTGEGLELEELTAVLDKFLGNLDPEARRIFMRRYWYFSKPAEIASAFGISEHKVYKSLQRTRAKLKDFLRKEGFSYDH